MLIPEKLRLPTPEQALPGRDQPVTLSNRHWFNGHSLQPPYPEGLATCAFALGCFWGAERKFWQTPGVYSTAVGYAGGLTKNPSYREVCSSLTGHAEAVWVVFDPEHIRYQELLVIFWQAHDPTQGMRQGNDMGSQYRSMILTTTPEQAQLAAHSAAVYQRCLAQAGYGTITTEILPLNAFYYAEEEHQQYLGKNPDGYCGLSGLPVLWQA
ncbi:MAG: peptide-methionine (S)-S-oxide reductase MsrA [Methylococcales bacterium]|nr:peptide-methionine (S)-S-oxide reductase MsrA [Methylococcales bacterium]